MKADLEKLAKYSYNLFEKFESLYETEKQERFSQS